MSGGRAAAAPAGASRPAGDIPIVLPAEPPDHHPTRGMVCHKCADDRPLGRVRFRLTGDTRTRWTKPLCFICRVRFRRFVRRRGGEVLVACRAT